MIESGDGWYVADGNGLAQGPLTRAELQALRDGGKIGDEHLVWTLRQAEWVPLRRALGLAQTVASGAAGGRTPVAVAAKPAKTKTPKVAGPKPMPGTTPHRQNDSDWRKSLGREAPALLGQALIDAEKLKGLGARRDLALQALRRLLARNIDLTIFGGIGWAVLTLFGARSGLWYLPSPNIEMQSALILALLLLLLAALPLEILLVGLSGYSPGRLLLGLRVVDAHGAAPGLVIAAHRSLRVAVLGQGLLLPPFSLIAYGVSFATLLGKGRTAWDQALNLTVRSVPLSIDRWWAAIAVTAIAWALLVNDVWLRIVYALSSG